MMNSLRGRVALVATALVAGGFTATGVIVLAISSFAAEAGHEVRTPLTTIQADLDSLLR
ncbi:MAG: hypothetical protein ACR2HR_15005 [Euzebya sp.]